MTTGADHAFIRCRGLTKVYRKGDNEIVPLAGLDLDIARGSFVSLMGPSGSGKSTLLNIVGLLDRPTQGELTMTGQETTRMSDAQMTHLRGHTIGFVFQYHHLLGAFSTLENVMMPMFADTGFATEVARLRASTLLGSVGLTPWLHVPASHLSGGQQQRVAVARALAMKPALILADEPTGNLDSKSADSVFELLQRVCKEQGTAVLFVTHNPMLSARCDRTIEVVDGKVLSA